MDADSKIGVEIFRMTGHLRRIQTANPLRLQTYVDCLVETVEYYEALAGANHVLVLRWGSSCYMSWRERIALMLACRKIPDYLLHRSELWPSCTTGATAEAHVLVLSDAIFYAQSDMHGEVSIPLDLLEMYDGQINGQSTDEESTLQSNWESYVDLFLWTSMSYFNVLIDRFQQLPILALYIFLGADPRISIVNSMEATSVGYYSFFSRFFQGRELVIMAPRKYSRVLYWANSGRQNQVMPVD
ncbi:hypothetical protein BDW69DRAFT_174815 [Aspergillus filifer]